MNPARFCRFGSVAFAVLALALPAHAALEVDCFEDRPVVAKPKPVKPRVAKPGEPVKAKRVKARPAAPKAQPPATERVRIACPDKAAPPPLLVGPPAIPFTPMGGPPGFSLPPLVFVPPAVVPPVVGLPPGVEVMPPEMFYEGPRVSNPGTDSPPATVPIPGSLALIALGVAALALRRVA